MRIFKNRWFSRFVRQHEIDDQDLCEAIQHAEHGLIDADLGSGVIKQRIARRNEGKSGGFRCIVLFRTGERSFFVYGFAKSVRSNITSEELKGFKALAIELFAYSNANLRTAVDAGALTEVICDEQNL